MPEQAGNVKARVLHFSKGGEVPEPGRARHHAPGIGGFFYLPHGGGRGRIAMKPWSFMDLCRYLQGRGFKRWSLRGLSPPPSGPESSGGQPARPRDALRASPVDGG